MSSNSNATLSVTINEVLDFNVVFSAIFGSLILVSTIPNIEPGILCAQFIINLLLVASINIVAIFRKQIAPMTKAHVILIMLFVVTFVDLLIHGLLSSNKVFFIAIPTFAIIVFDYNKTIRIFIFSNILFSAIAYLTLFDANPFIQDANQDINSALSWFVNYLELLIVATGIFVFVYHFNNALKKSFFDLKKHTDELEVLVEERTEELHRNNKELKKLNSTKDRLFRIIGHDMKAPMVYTLSSVDMMKSSGEALPNELLNEISHTTGQNIKLLENLLNWSMSQLEEIKYAPKPLIIHELLTEQIDGLRHIANEKNIDLYLQVDAGLEVNADPNMLMTIVRNLISNALKFTSTNGVITVSVEKEQNAYYFSIQDTGVGMDSEVKDKLFKPDEMQTSRGTNNEQGTGIGLLICKEFVERHEGKIWVDSILGVGSNFQFSIPIR